MVEISKRGDFLPVNDKKKAKQLFKKERKRQKRERTKERKGQKNERKNERENERSQRKRMQPYSLVKLFPPIIKCLDIYL